MLLWIHHSVQAESMLTLRCPQPTVWHGGSHRSWPFYTLYIIHVSPDRQSLVRDFLSLLMRIIELHCGLGFSFLQFSSVQFSRSVMSDCLRPHESQHASLPVQNQLLEFTQTHVHRVGDAIQPSHPLSSPS